MIKILLLFALFLISPNCFSQDSLITDKSISENFINDTEIVITDFLSFYTEPFNFSSTEWLYTAGIFGGTFLLFSVDQEITNEVGRKTIATLNNDFWDIPTRYGITPYATVFSLSTYAAGLLFKQDDIRITGRLLFESLTISGVGIIAIRYLAGRERPYYDKGEWAFKGFQTSNEFQSFPSGHTSVAFALSTVLAERIDNFWARLGFYGMATLTATARVINNQHFLSDVVWGALLGFGAGMYVVHKEQELEKGNSLSIYPGLNKISIVYSF
ncbi:MAG TPA: phosphatase PAP2 family protein [Ignavibacteriaceae bacterium]|nr:phosphatase PAP2 family protein [Ignavibacteriaceae bacterium]